MVVTDPDRVRFEDGTEQDPGWDPIRDGPPPPDELAALDAGGLFALGDEWTEDGEDGAWIHIPDGESVFRVRTLSADGTPSVGTEAGVADAGHDGNGTDQPGPGPFRCRKLVGTIEHRNIYEVYLFVCISICIYIVV